MASRAQTPSPVRTVMATLADPARSIGTPRFDALLFWGVPLLAFGFTLAVVGLATITATLGGQTGLALVIGIGSILTYAHLFAVFPRAYLNHTVFVANRRRLLWAPLVLLVLFILSPAALAIGVVVAFFWDVHHSAMQTFGLARIYDLRAGNDAHVLRRTDLRLNWALYVGPIAAGAAFMTHADALKMLDGTALAALTQMPGLLLGEVTVVRALAIVAWIGTVGWAVIDYRHALAKGYRLPAHKAMVVGITGLVSILAWGLSSPLIAFFTVNLYHALQYFAIVWLKEGARMAQLRGIAPRRAFGWFIGACLAGGTAYALTAAHHAGWLLAPFIAVSLLHFWYDSFVWSVRRAQV